MQVRHRPSKYVQEDAEKKTTDKTSTAGDNDDSESPSAEESDGTSVQDTASPETAGRIGVVRRSIFFVDKSQRIASEGFSSFINQVDGFFSNAGADDDDVTGRCSKQQG